MARILRPSWKSGKPLAKGKLTPPSNSRQGGPHRSALLAKCLQRDSCDGTKPFSSTLRLKIWAPRGDRAPATTLPRTGAVPPVQARGPGEPLLLAPLLAVWGRPTPVTPEGPLQPVQGWREQREWRTHPAAESARRLLASAARPPGHMARSPAEDQRGFVASEQGASQSAGRGRRDCDCFRRENWLRGAGPGEPRRGAGGGEGSSCSPGSRTGSRGVLSMHKKHQGAEFPSQPQSPRKESDAAPREELQAGKGARGSPGRTARLPLQESMTAQPRPLLPAQPLPGCWVVPRI